MEIEIAISNYLKQQRLPVTGDVRRPSESDIASALAAGIVAALGKYGADVAGFKAALAA
jgi:hypothetical protein